MRAIVGALFLAGGLWASGRGVGGLMGFLGGASRDAFNRAKKGPGEYETTREITVGRYTFMFEEARSRGEVDPKGFINAWVVMGWPGYDRAREMYQNGEWKKLIAEALGISPRDVRLGFGRDEFDVRPF